MPRHIHSLTGFLSLGSSFCLLKKKKWDKCDVLRIIFSEQHHQLPSASPKKILNGEKRKACHVKVIVVLSPSIFGHLLQNAKICHSWTPHPYEKLWVCVCVCLSEKAGRRSAKCYAVAALLCCDCLSVWLCVYPIFFRYPYPRSFHHRISSLSLSSFLYLHGVSSSKEKWQPN